MTRNGPTTGSKMAIIPQTEYSNKERLRLLRKNTAKRVIHNKILTSISRMICENCAMFAVILRL